MRRRDCRRVFRVGLGPAARIHGDTGTFGTGATRRVSHDSCGGAAGRGPTKLSALLASRVNPHTDVHAAPALCPRLKAS